MTETNFMQTGTAETLVYPQVHMLILQLLSQLQLFNSSKAEIENVLLKSESFKELLSISERQIKLAIEEKDNQIQALLKENKEIKVSVLQIQKLLEEQNSLLHSCQCKLPNNQSHSLETMTEGNMQQPLDLAPAEETLRRLLQGRSKDEALIDASKAGNVAEIALLLNSGADIQAKDPKNMESPLHWATEYGHLEACRLLVSRGAALDATATGWYNFTPLHVAANNGHLAVFKFLVQSGADLSAESSFWETPEDRAIVMRHTNIVKWLREVLRDFNA